LNQILKNEFPELLQRSTIITGQFHDRPYDLSKGARCPPKNAFLLMNLIKVKDPIVMNCLIDQRSIETIVLVDE
jgi:hypothetical protein